MGTQFSLFLLGHFWLPFWSHFGVDSGDKPTTSFGLDLFWNKAIGFGMKFVGPDQFLNDISWPTSLEEAAMGSRERRLLEPDICGVLVGVSHCSGSKSKHY